MVRVKRFRTRATLGVLVHDGAVTVCARVRDEVVAIATSRSAPAVSDRVTAIVACVDEVLPAIRALAWRPRMVATLVLPYQHARICQVPAAHRSARVDQLFPLLPFSTTSMGLGGSDLSGGHWAVVVDETFSASVARELARRGVLLTRAVPSVAVPDLPSAHTAHSYHGDVCVTARWADGGRLRAVAVAPTSGQAPVLGGAGGGQGLSPTPAALATASAALNPAWNLAVASTAWTPDNAPHRARRGLLVACSAVILAVGGALTSGGFAAAWAERRDRAELDLYRLGISRANADELVTMRLSERATILQRFAAGASHPTLTALRRLTDALPKDGMLVSVRMAGNVTVLVAHVPSPSLFVSALVGQHDMGVVTLEGPVTPVVVSASSAAHLSATRSAGPLAKLSRITVRIVASRPTT